MMASAPALRELALVVNSVLSSYLAVHAEIQRESATFWSMVKNTFGRGVPMTKLLADAESLLPVLAQVEDRVLGFRRNPAYSSMSADEQRYYDVLRRYVEALWETVSMLVERQRLAAAGSTGAPMALDEMRRRDTAYRESIHRYMVIGQELTAAGPTVFTGRE